METVKWGYAMDFDLIAPVVLGLLGGLAGAVINAILPIRNPKTKIGLGAHEHRYDTMKGDGKGWRCGICGQPRGGR